jgi:hypothetical protein
MRQQLGCVLYGALLTMAITLPAAAADFVAKMQKVTPDGTGESRLSTNQPAMRRRRGG